MPTVPEDSPVPVRATESVSIRDIAEGDSIANSTSPIELKSLAFVRGITDRRFALRELITRQTTSAARKADTAEPTWENWLSDHSTDAKRFRPTNADQVRAIVVEAAREGKQLRAVGGGHSHSKVAKLEDDEWYFDLHWYGTDQNGDPDVKGLVDLAPNRWLKPSDERDVAYKDRTDAGDPEKDKFLVRARAGNHIKYTNRHLLKQQDLALFNIGSYDAQTLAGVINTGTHGTGALENGKVNFGSLADDIESVELLTVMKSAKSGAPVVRKFRIEPANGITNRGVFEDDIGEHGMALIQNDEVFHSVVSAYGSMGIATAYTIGVRPRFFLREKNDIRTWQELRDGGLRTYLKRGDVHHLQIFVNVPAAYNDLNIIEDLGINFTPKVKCLVRYHERIDWRSRGNYPDDAFPPERSGGAGGVRRTRNKISGGGGLDPLTPHPMLGIFYNQYFKRQRGGGPFSRRSGNFKGDPNGPPPDRDNTASYIAFRRLADQNGKQVKKPPSEASDQAISMELAVPLADVEDAVDAAIDSATSVNTSESELGPEIDYDWSKNKWHDDKLRFSAPMGIRFVGPSKHLLTPEYTPDLDGSGPWADGVAKLELAFSVRPISNTGGAAKTAGKLLNILSNVPAISVLSGVPVHKLAGVLLPGQNVSREDMLTMAEYAFRPVEDDLVRQHGARPHLGKFSHLDASELRAMYDEYDTWATTAETFNVFGTFGNDFTDRIGVSQRY
jgi:hypothetical protein